MMKKRAVKKKEIVVKDETMKITAEDAAKIIRRETQAQIQACGQAIQRVLQQFKCQMIAQPFITPEGRIGARVNITPVQQPPGG